MIPRLLSRSSYRWTLNRSLSTTQSYLATQQQPKPELEWSTAVKEAERVVGYTTSFLNLRWILNDEMANVAEHMRRLIGTQHPLLKTAKNFIYKTDDTPAWGLVVLLMSKVGGLESVSPEVERDRSTGILYSQRVLAEVTEMIRTSILIHKGLINVTPETPDAKDMIHGNKIALLSGDRLLSKCCDELANLRNQPVNEIISSTVRDFSEGEFIGPRDKQNEPLPAKPNAVLQSSGIFNENNTNFGPFESNKILGNPLDEWVLRSILGGANLLGKSCLSTLLLAEHDIQMQEQGFLFGKHLALAWQAKLEKELFYDFDNINLVSAPILLHLNKDPSLYSEIEKGMENIENCDIDEIKRIVGSGTALEETDELKREFANRALNNISYFKENDARRALEKMITAM